MITPPARSHIDVRAIERELSALWQSAADQAEAGRAAPVTRTCLVNLVVVTGGRAGAAQATRVVEALTGIYPNRAIVAAMLTDEPREAAAPALDAWVQAHCQLPAPGRPQVCGEQITIEARGEAAQHVYGVVLPLLVPDVPVVIWLPSGEPAAHPAVPKLADVADRVIVDSATFAAPEQGMAAVAALLDADTTVSDLAWARLTVWRDLVAQFFDAPAMRRHLSEVERVQLSVPEVDGRFDRSQALLLLGWVASQLGWRLSADRPPRFARPDGGEVSVEIARVGRAQPTPDHLAGVVLACSHAQFAVERTAGGETIATRVKAEGMWPLQRSVPVERLTDAALLAGELQLLGRDRIFERALRVAALLADRV
jgi:glucose-6-phosphate dehydrogenase assembly protein OpcA